MADDEKRHSQEGATLESANEKHEQALSDTSSTAGSIRAVKGEKGEISSGHDHAKSADGARGAPDIDHEEAEASVPGHELDVELGQVSPYHSGATCLHVH